MARIALLSIALWLGLAGFAVAQIQSQPVNNPGQPQAGAADSGQHNSTFDAIIALTGAALVLLVVCYPSRRY